MIDTTLKLVKCTSFVRRILTCLLLSLSTLAFYIVAINYWRDDNESYEDSKSNSIYNEKNAINIVTFVKNKKYNATTVPSSAWFDQRKLQLDSKENAKRAVSMSKYNNGTL